MTDYKNKKTIKNIPERDELFKKKKMHLFDETRQAVSKDLESDTLIKVHADQQKTFFPALNVKDPRTFANYGSAVKYYQDAFYNIQNYSPFDGTQEEVIQWMTSSSPVTVALYQQHYPRKKGVTNFSYSEYISFYAGPQIFESKQARPRFIDLETGLKINPSKGNTVEFWLNKKAFSDSNSKEIIFDIGTHKDYVAEQSKGQFRLLLSNSSGTPDHSPFRLTYLSGTTGVNDLRIGSNKITKSTVADGKWHHYALSIKQTGTKLKIDFYVDGKHDITQKGNVASMGSVDSYMGGALGTGNTSLTGTLSASLDDFRFWKGYRTGREIGRFYDHRVYASDIKNTDYTSRLGLYYKFNEGLTGKLKTDSTVLDYSGNNILGKINNYTSASRTEQSAIDLSENTENTEVPDVVMFQDNLEVQALKVELANIGEQHDLANQNSLTRFLPNWATDRHGDAYANTNDDFAILLHLLAIQFDEIKLNLDSIRRNTGILYDDSFHNVLNESTYQLSGSSFVDNNSLGCSTEDEIDLIYPGNRIDFPLRKLRDAGFDVRTYPIVSEATAAESVEQKSGLIRLLKTPEQTSMLILENMFTCATNCMKKKGTVNVSDNIIGSFGANRDIITKNIYSNNSEIFLDNTKKEITTLKKSSINFIDNTSNVLYMKSSDTNSRSFLAADTEEVEYTFEGTFSFPSKTTDSFTITDSSIFGIHSVPAIQNTLQFLTPDNASIQVSVLKSSNNDVDSKFVLSSTSNIFSQIETVEIPNIYTNSVWNIALRIRKDLDNKFIKMPQDSNYKVELIGHNYILDYLNDSFHISASISQSAYESFKNSNKTVFIGAHRTNITGSVLKKSDIKFINFNAWNDALTDEELTLRAQTPTYHGRNMVSFGKELYSSGSSEMYNNRILSIELNRSNEMSSDGTISIQDFSSGSVESRLFDGDLLGYRYNFTSLPFTQKTSRVLSSEFLPSIRDIPVGNILAEDGISIKDSELDKFTISSEIETSVISFEKSMYQAISREMVDFISGMKAMNNLIGEPADKYRLKYKSLDYVKQRFFRFIENENEFERFTRYYKWINKAIGEFLQQVLPASSFSNTGIENVVESHVLERNKYDHKLPTLEYKEPKLVGQLLGINELLYDWEHGHAPLDTVPYRRPAKSLKFDQSGSPKSYVLVPDNDVFTLLNGSSNAPFTMAAWIRPSNQDSTRIILSKFHHDTEAAANEWMFGHQGRRLFFIFQHGPSGNQWVFNSSVNVLSDTLNTWQHVAVTFNKTSAKFYVNGALINTTTGTKDAGFTTTTNTPAVLLIGQKFTGTTIGFRGQMRDVVHVKHADSVSPFDDNQIRELYNNGHSWDLQEHSRGSEIDAWWPLGAEGDVEDVTMRDNSGNNHHGTPSSPTSFVLDSGLLYEIQVLSEDNNCLWWKDRAIRGSDNTPVHVTDSNRETLREAKNTLVSGSTYVLRKLSRPYKYSVDRQQFFGMGSNAKANKIKDFYKIVNLGHDIVLNSNNIYEQEKCSDVIEPSKKTKFVAKTDTTNTSGYLDGDAELILPFSLVSSSADKHLSSFKTDLILTNNNDKTPALQGPFVSRVLGGYPHETVDVGTPKQNRPEAYKLEVSAGSLKVTKTTGPKSFVKLGPGGSPFYNVANIKRKVNLSGSGNYKDEYEIVQIHGRSQNNNYLVETEGVGFSSGFQESGIIPGLIDYTCPKSETFNRKRRSHVIVSKFSAIGSADAAAAYGKDRESEEFSVYNTVNYRNSTVREVYNHFSSERTKQFGLRPVSETIGSIHKINRNSHNKVNTQGTKYDNFFVQHQIPRNDFGYSWISASAFCSVDDFVKRNAGRGHQHTFGISGSVATGFLESFETINFLTASQLGLRKHSTGGDLLFGMELAYPNNLLATPAAFVDFAGTNTIIFDPIEEDTNTVGYPLIEFTKSGHFSDINYINSVLSKIKFNSLAQSSVDNRDVAPALVLNSVILNRQGPYGWPTWKQIRGDQHPITISHKKNNKISVCFRGNVPFVSCYPGSKFEYQDTVEDNQIKKDPRTVKNYHETMVTSKYKPIIVSMHPTNEETMIELFSDDISVPMSDLQVAQKKMWYNDIHFHSLIKQENNRAGGPEVPSFNYRVPLQNVVTSFANDNLIKDIKYKETKISNTKNIKKINNLLSNRNPFFIKEVNYAETIYPRERNTYTSNARVRKKFNFFGWNSSRSKRALILSGNINYSNTFLISTTTNKMFLSSEARVQEVDFNKSYFNTYDIIDINSTGSKAAIGSSTYITSSTWVLDSRKDFNSRPFTIRYGFMSSQGAGLGENFLDRFRTNNPLGSFAKRHVRQGTAGNGILQNDYSMWPLGHNGLRGLPPFAPVYNRKIPQHTTNGDFLAGGARWQTADGLEKGPFYDSYEQYAEETKIVGQDYSLIPEFTISKFIEDIHKSSDFKEASLRNDFLQLTGAVYHSSSATVGVGSQFFKTYSNTDFMKYFQPVAKEMKDNDFNIDAGKLTLKCQAVKRLLPYRGFYPAERTVQLSEIFHRNYLMNGSFEANYEKNTAIPKATADALFKLRLENSKAQVMKPLFAPGVLYNSIKSGVAVDYPIFSSDISSFLSTIENAKGSKIGHVGGYDFAHGLTATAGFIGSHINNTTDEGIPRIKSDISRRITFEDLLKPERLYEEIIYDNEPHPSASSLYGTIHHMKVLERPPTFGSFNKTETLNKTSTYFSNTRQSFQYSMLPYKSAMNNFASETVKFFLKDEKLTTIISEPVEEKFTSGVNYKMRVYLANSNTAMYDRHSAFGPPVDEGNLNITSFSSDALGADPGLHTNIRLTFNTASSFDFSFLTGTAQLPGIELTDKDNNKFTFKFFNRQTFSPEPDHTSNVRFVGINTTGEGESMQLASARFLRAATGSSIAATFVTKSNTDATDADLYASVQISSSGDTGPLTNESVAFINGGITETVVINSTDANANRITSNSSVAWTSGSPVAGTAQFTVSGGGNSGTLNDLQNTLDNQTAPTDEQLPELTVIDSAGRTIKVRLYIGGSSFTGGLVRTSVTNQVGSGTMTAASGDNKMGIAYVNIQDGSTNTFLSDNTLRNNIVTAINSVKTSDFATTVANNSGDEKIIDFTMVAGAKGSAALTGQNGFVGGTFSSGHPLAGDSIGSEIAGTISESPFDGAAAATNETLTLDFATNASTKSVLDRITNQSNLPSITIGDGDSSRTPRIFKFYSTSGISSPSGESNTSFVAITGVPNTDAATFRSTVTSLGGGVINITAGGSNAQVILTDDDTGTSTDVSTANATNLTTVDPRNTILASTPAWVSGIAANSNFTSQVTKPTTNLKNNSHGFLPFVPPFLDPNTRPYVQLSFTPTQSRAYSIPEILDQITASYYNIADPSNPSNNTNYITAMCLSASINFNRYIKLNRDNYRTNDNGTIIPDSNTNKYRWVIQTKWETPILDFENVSVDAAEISTDSALTDPTLTVDSVVGSPWKRRYQTNYYEERAAATKNYHTSSTGIWHQRGSLIDENNQKGYHLVVEGSIHDINKGQGDLARMCGFVSRAADKKKFQNNFVSKKIGVLSKKKTISEAVVAIPYYLTEDCKMKLFNLDDEAYSSAQTLNALRKSERISSILNSETQEQIDYVNSIYQIFHESTGTTAETNIAYQLRMMDKYILPLQFDFIKNTEVPKHVQYIFQFKSDLTDQDLADIWQNIYPTSKKGPAVAEHSGVSFNPGTTEVEYISGFLNTNNIPILNNRKSNYETPQDFLNNEVRWLVFKAKYRANSYYDDLIQDSISDLGGDIIEVNGKRIRDGGLKVSTEKQLLSKLSYNWPYDYFSLVELIKLDSKVDFYSTHRVENPPKEGGSSFGPGIPRINLSSLTDQQRFVYQSVGQQSDESGAALASEQIASNMVIQEVVKAGGVTPSNARSFVALDSSVRTGTETVFLNGIIQQNGSDRDYTMSGNTVTFNFDIDADDTISIGYIKQ